MNLRNLNVKNRTHKLIYKSLNNKKISQIYKIFEQNIDLKENFAVAVSGGADSLSLAYLSKVYSLKNSLKIKFYIVDHKLRKESSHESKTVQKQLKKIGVNSKILVWSGKKPSSNIQSIARNKRYQLISKECRKNKINYLLLGHHMDDLLENFFIRVLRGSGLNGLVSFDKKTKNENFKLNFLRPLLDINKKDLIYLTKKVFNFFIEDPSNKNENFKRIKIRNLIQVLEKEGLDKEKFFLTINNLKDTNKTIKFYVNLNISTNSLYFNKKNYTIINSKFFLQSHEVVFRSLTQIIKKIGNKSYPVRGKSVDELISKINKNLLTRSTLGGCFIEKINKTVKISREN